MQTFNINDTVHVKITAYGHAELERQHNELLLCVPSLGPYTPKAIDDGGYSKFHLINEKRNCATLSATVYADTLSGLYAVRVPSMGTVTITTKFAMYPTKSDDSFRIGKLRGCNE